MSTYNDLLKQIGDLQIKAEKARQDEIQAAVKQVNALIAEHGLTANDLSFGSARKKASPNKGVAIKYRDAAGNTWTGRGRTPTWLAQAESSGKTRESFLIA